MKTVLRSQIGCHSGAHELLPDSSLTALPEVDALRGIIHYTDDTRRVEIVLCDLNLLKSAVLRDFVACDHCLSLLLALPSRPKSEAGTAIDLCETRLPHCYRCEPLFTAFITVCRLNCFDVFGRESLHYANEGHAYRQHQSLSCAGIDVERFP